MQCVPVYKNCISQGSTIISDAENLGLDPKKLYSVVVDLSSEGLYTAHCINMAAGILLEDLRLPRYFFENISKITLSNLLTAIASSLKVIEGEVRLNGNVAQVHFEEESSPKSQQIWIATEESRQNMEEMLEDLLCGRRREYYSSGKYHTYIIKPERISDFPDDAFTDSPFLFSVAGYSPIPEVTKKRYHKFLLDSDQSTIPVIGINTLQESEETRFMFYSDFASPQLPVLRKLLSSHGLLLTRAYWEPVKTQDTVPASICTLYVEGELNHEQKMSITADLRDFLSYSVDPVQHLFLQDKVTFHEMLFAGNCVDFTHLFIFKETENSTDQEILANLTSKDQREAFARRVQGANRSTYGTPIIREALCRYPDLIKFLYSCFEQKFSPLKKDNILPEAMEEKHLEYEKLITRRFLNYPVGYEIMAFMFKIITSTLKTNFYKLEKRSFSFRFDNSVLDPLVYRQVVHGVFYVNGHYASGTHLRAADIARGGLRLIRVSHSNYDEELDNALLLNYALGPMAQRMKHKDICESGSKGVVLPLPQYAEKSREALNDYTEGIMDLVIPHDAVIDYLGQQEMVFFGPDEGTALLMDDVAFHARDKGYPHWRTLTTGKSFGIPHDTYGILSDGRLFGLFDRGRQGVELQIDGKSIVITNDMQSIHAEIGNDIELSGMTTCSIMSSFRTLIASHGEEEENLNLMITGGPDGDLGANQIQCYKGNICLIIDGGSVLFDPLGLDKEALRKIAFSRNSSPRSNTLAFPREKLSEAGFLVPRNGQNIPLPDGTMVEDGAIFHKTFLYDPTNRKYIQQANIRAFIPCGGLKDTINNANVKNFLSVFKELQFIVEGANVFFDDSSRRYIASATDIKQIKDSTANKGGVFSSSIAEVLPAFLLGDTYESQLLHDTNTRWMLIRNVLLQVKKYAAMETSLLLDLHKADSSVPLSELSELSSEKIFALQDLLEKDIQEICNDVPLTRAILEAYIPSVLRKKLGMENIMELLNKNHLQPYRNAIITKKAASTAYYMHGNSWDTFLSVYKQNKNAALHAVFDVK
ncbi:NAD-glutamate dehydrogenase domain-containing protein [Desulfogranum japonicum]|uniref:NAD-glutamate dehydrogenase domain-containing protein n=1 Tax=Desulfogranum japonicum TaxID=231447 RepID=UPI00040F9BC6|nr:NAD-glutamate dehydrogenase domain-containing protein [Desulfogranum japonicum]